MKDIIHNMSTIDNIDKNSPLKIRVAMLTDFNEVAAMFKNAITNMNNNGLYQWDDTYPDENLIRSDIENGEMYLSIVNDRIVASATVNQMQEPEFETGDWKYHCSLYAVIHRMCVDPGASNRGIGARTILAIEGMMKDKGFESIRLDTYSQNPIAIRLYEKLNYDRVGCIRYDYIKNNRVRDVFYLFEKKL